MMTARGAGGVPPEGITRERRAAAGKALAVFLGAMALLTWTNRILENMTIATVSTASIQRGSLEIQVSASGTLAARTLIPVYAPESAKVTRVNASAGASVNAGDPLFTLDYTDIIKSSSDALDNARADLDSKRQSLDWAAADLPASAMSRLNDRLANLDALAEKLDEANASGSPEAIAKALSNYDEEKRRLDGDKAIRDYMAKLDALEASQRKYGDAEEDYQSVMSAVDGDGLFVVTAPGSGTVTKVSASVGSMSSPASAAVMIADADGGLTVSITVAEDQAAAFTVGDAATVYAGETAYQAAIESISPSAAQAGSFDLAFALPSAAGAPGVSATVRLSKRSASYDTIIPLSALRVDGDGDFVYAISQNTSALGTVTTVSRVGVTILEQDNTRAALAGGLSQRDTIVARSDRALGDGDRVRLEE
ncbi:MAG: efflux RND transporter periplasmic adaptor subunit [Oscillospiraceae bacterium]|jgi:multidrug efflux pump subunit AcrA (membrane-fusion protein)|nr:efflux RND transporter periplasmic adaptor subunit [Oscillospiraceae bacterium]